jgi:FkbM family methyltransferase
MPRGSAPATRRRGAKRRADGRPGATGNGQAPDFKPDSEGQEETSTESTPRKRRNAESSPGPKRARRQAASGRDVAETSPKQRRAARQRAPKRARRQARAALQAPTSANAEERGLLFEHMAQYVPYVGVVTEEGRFVVSTSDRMGRSLFAKQARPEFRVLDRAVAVVEALHGEGAIGGRSFVDVGANIGTSTIAALLRHRFGSAVALEPQEDNYRVLKANVAMNEQEGRVRTVNVAVSDRLGRFSLVLVGGEAHKGWIETEPEKVRQLEEERAREAEEAGDSADPPAELTVTDVELVSLDHLTASGVIDESDVGMLWIDAEGHEGHVLAGANTLTERGVPVVFEFCPDHLETRGDRAKLDAVVENSYTHFTDVRRTEVDGGPRKLRPVTDLWKYGERFQDPARPGQFTDLLLLRLDEVPRDRETNLDELVKKQLRSNAPGD